MHYSIPARYCSFFIFITSALADNTRSVIACLQTKNVPFDIETSKNWTALVTPYNLQLQYIRAVITVPSTLEQVASAVGCAAQHNLKVQAKSGGHSYASYSNGGVDGSLIVNLQEFNTVVLDKDTGIAEVGAGVRLGNIAVAIFEQGSRALPRGTYPAVGTGGHITHGGYRHSSRLWDLALDAIVELDVVLANGSQIFTSQSLYPEVYYALQGATDSFGIVTTFHMQTKLAPSNVINFAIQIPAALDNVSAVVDGFLAMQKAVLNPKIVNGNVSFAIYTDQTGTFNFGGWCIECDLDIFNNVTLPALIGGYPAAKLTNVTSLEWIDSLLNLAGSVPLEVPFYGYHDHDTFYAKSVVIKNVEPLDEDQLTTFWNYIITQGKGAQYPWFSIINLYGGIGSRINAAASGESAYPDRDALWVFKNYGNTANNLPPYRSDITTFIDYLTPSVAANQSDDFSAYLNYVDPNLSPPETIHPPYGQPNYDKLLGIKKQIDPSYVFWNPQAVGMVEGKPVAAFMGAAERLGLIGGWLLLYIFICGIGLGSFF